MKRVEAVSSPPPRQVKPSSACGWPCAVRNRRRAGLHREEVVITRAGHDPVVMVALDDYESLKETAYLLKIPENARRLLASIDRLEHGDGVVHDLAE